LIFTVVHFFQFAWALCVKAVKANNLKYLEVNYSKPSSAWGLIVPKSLQYLDLRGHMLISDDIMTKIEHLTNLTVLKCTVDENATVGSLYSLRSLRRLEEFHFEVSNNNYDTLAMLMSQILQILPHLRVAGTSDKDWKSDPNFDYSHIVPLFSEPLNLEHLSLTLNNFSYDQAMMLPNLKTLKVFTFIPILNLYL